MDSLSWTLQNVGSYLSQNKDLLANPVIGAAGELAAFGLTELGKKQILNLINRKNKSTKTELHEKDLEILQKLMSASNIIGSGIKHF